MSPSSALKSVYVIGLHLHVTCQVMAFRDNEFCILNFFQDYTNLFY